MRKRILSVFILVFLFYGFSYSQNYVSIKGITIDSASNKPIEYVNIGIFKKNIGTVSNEKGLFEIQIPKEYSKDSILFSCIGYQTKKVYIPNLVKSNKTKVLLQPKDIKLPEVNISSNKLTRQIVGNKTTSESIGLAISYALGYGSEIGTRIKLPDKSVMINNFNFNIYYDRPDSALFRLKIYSYKKGIDTLLINKNIFFTVRNHYTGIYKLDLRKYHIVVNNDIFVSIECLKEYTHGYNSHIKNDNKFYDRIIISAKLLGSKSFIKEVSQGEWIKPEMGKSPAFWLDVLY